MKPAQKAHTGGSPTEVITQARRWQLALEGAEEGVWDWDPVTDKVYYSHHWKAMLGYSDDEIGQTLDEWETRVHPDDRAECLEAIRRHLAGETPIYSNEHRVRCKDGSYKWVLDRGKVTSRTSSGLPRRVVGTHTDIQSRKEAESLLNLQRDLALALSATNDLNRAFEIILDISTGIDGLDCGGVYLVDQEQRSVVLVCHRGLSEEFVASTSFFAEDTPEARAVFRGEPIFQSYEDFVTGIGARTVDERLRSLVVIPILHAGKTIAALNLGSHTALVMSPSARAAIIAIASQLGDSILRLRAEKATRETETNLNTLFDTIGDFLFILDIQGNIIRINAAACQRLGYSADELKSMNVLQVHPPHRRDEAASVIRLMLAHELKSCHIPLIAKSGEQIPVETIVESGQWSGRDVLFGVSRDITERIRDQQALQESEEKNRALFTNEIYAICIVTPDTMKILDANDAFLRLYGYTRDELITHLHLQDISVEREAARIDELRTLNTGALFVPIRYHRKKDGAIFPVEIVMSPYTWMGKKVFYAMIHDISHRIQAEEGVTRLLNEKQMLLREVHHRIKNNLMTVASMLSLEAEASETRPVRAVLLDARNRIESMGRIYETVYRSTDYTTMGSGQYLTRVITDIHKTFAASDQIALTIDISDSKMDTKMLYPLGIIIYELVTNAHKYAFIGREVGKISVSLKELQRGGAFNLEVCDDGIGIPQNVIDRISEGFGYSLIRIFLEQLRGTIMVARNGGTHVSITFPR
jgi:PAS domain S-box-containing protein